MDQNSFWEEFDQFCLDLHASLWMDEVLAVAVNEGRRLIDCDRLSIALQFGRKCQVRAVSGQDRVVNRSKLVKTLVHLSAEVIRVREAMTYTGSLDGYAPQIEAPLAEYLQESQSRMISMLPLLENPELVCKAEEQKPRRAAKPRRTIGCLIVEQSREALPRPDSLERVELLADHIATAISNARMHQTVFLLPVLQAIGRTIAWLHGRRRWAAAAIATALMVFVLICVFVKCEYRVTATGRLMPTQRSDVFAPWDGEVIEIFVEDGQAINKGEPLVRLENDELRAELVVRTAELDEKAKLVRSLQGQLDRAERTGLREESIRLQGELKKAEIELGGTHESHRLLSNRIQKLTVTSPLDGIVAAFQVHQDLFLRPVQRGNRLLQVVSPEGSWELVLEVPEHRSGHVLTALNSSESRTLSLTYVLATEVERKLRGELTYTATRADASEKQGSIVFATAHINKEELRDRHVGAEVHAKIDCGKKALGYVLFGDVIEFFQRHVWF